MQHKAKKVVIITEKVISQDVAKLIDECGATGYTITPAGGKGSRGVRSQGADALFETNTNVKFEVITSSAELAKKIYDRVADQYFENYSGITYMEDVDILRPQKF
jgi:nitrogen regulatory protein PII